MTNFANWYAYYRDRLSMMKTGVGRTFAGLDDNYRVGFMTIHTTPSDTSRYVQIKTFDAGQKTSWYNKLYSISTTGSTPLREALSTAGKMYAGKALVDPVQYSCQKNFTILSTDGMWNGANGSKIDNSAIGNQDNDLAVSPRPKYDGNLLSTTAAGGGVTGGAETLADVAMYYYKTDLRTSALSNCTGALGAPTDVCQNNVAPSKKDPASHQHMTLFSIGLGVDGILEFRSDYETATTGDFAQIKTGAKNWPSPTNDYDTAIDDLWHAAVNAGGTYYSAKNPQALSDGLGDALREVGSRGGSAAAASTSNPQVTTTDNYVFSANYRTAFWDSVIRRRRVSVTTGELSKTIDWEAGAVLNTMVSATADTRTIHMFSAAAANKLKPFTWASLNAADKAYLDVNSWADPSTRLSQWGVLTATGKAAAKAPGALIGFLRGQSSLEDDVGNPDIPFRGRENVLGDIVNAETVYLKKSTFNYADAGHKNYVAWTDANRPVGALFAAANDGMLHALNADTGREVWAYVPSMVLPTISELADKNYIHEFYVDGTPEIGDVYDGSAWKTIIVGGLNKGGKGYYALDVTDPMSPKALWEFCNDSTLCTSSDANMGYSYGNPVITKLGSQWVVMFTSGHNNADGRGYLYVVNAITGVKLYTIQTSCTSANCGLAKIAPWIESSDNNTPERVYGGDLDGNIWRFDVADKLGPAGREAAKLAQVGAPVSALIQSITTKPALSKVGNDAVVFVGTGRFLGTSDKADSSINSFYAIKDDLVSPQGLVRTNGSLVKQTLTLSTNVDGRSVVTNSNNTVDWSSKSGWYLDFPNIGERVFTDPALALGTVTFTTNIPTTADPCSGGGISWLYELNWKTGGSVISAEKAINGALVSAKILASEFATRPVLIQLPDGNIVSITQLNMGDVLCPDGLTICRDSAVINHSTIPDKIRARRAGWREIIK
ncbi:MAG: PilC/PilY family type IV pilus protein [Burkholderiales bacterium]